jgi:hypothetical protein
MEFSIGINNLLFLTLLVLIKASSKVLQHTILGLLKSFIAAKCE